MNLNKSKLKLKSKLKKIKNISNSNTISKIIDKIKRKLSTHFKVKIFN